MIERCEHARFAFETHQSSGIGGDRRRNYLDRDVATQSCVARAIHLAHATRAEKREDFVAANARASRQWHFCRLYGAASTQKLQQKTVSRRQTLLQFARDRRGIT